MRIGLARRGYSATGGAEKFLIRFAQGLEAAGHDVVLFSDTRWPEGAWGERPLIPLTGAHTPRRFADALDLIRPRTHCDFLFSLERVWDCDGYRAGDGVHRAWLERRKVVESWWQCAFRRWNAKHCEILELESELFSEGREEKKPGIVFNSALVREEAIRYYGTELSRCRVIHNGFDAPAPVGGAPETQAHVRAAQRRELGLQDGEVAVLFTGSGWERKGLGYAIQAVERLNTGGGQSPGGIRTFRLLVAGKGKAHRYSGHPQVTFLGPVTEMEPLYAAADVFVLPTLYDPFSNACLEAAAYGLPVVTTDANGFSELLSDNVAGRFGGVVRVGEIAELAAAIRHVTHDQIPRAEIHDWAKQFSMARNVEATIGFIRERTGVAAS